MSASQAEQVLQLARIEGSNDEILRQLEPLVAGSTRGMEGAAKLEQLLKGVAAGGVAAERIKLDLSIARGLDYYTGTIFETTLDALPGIGSVCSGGRYDNLAELYTNQALPGIGASLGLDRLLAAMEELKLIEKVSTPAPVFLAFFDESRLCDYLRLAAAIRAAGIGVELFPEPKKLGQQLKYADRRGFRVAVIAGGDEFAAGRCQIKNLAAGSQEDVPLDEGARCVVEAIRRIVPT
jgi:histidyl-tRNA synthetase